MENETRGPEFDLMGNLNLVEYCWQIKVKIACDVHRVAYRIFLNQIIAASSQNPSLKIHSDHVLNVL